MVGGGGGGGSGNGGGGRNGGGSGGVTEKRRIVKGLVSAVRHVLCLLRGLFFWQQLAKVPEHRGWYVMTHGMMFSKSASWL